MPLKNPSFRIPPDRRFSPLWRRIQRAFSRDFLARDGTTKEIEDQLYVSKRVGPGLEEHDVLAHVDSSARKLLLVTGPAGIGKTTFLHHTLDRCRERSDIALVWIDVLRDVVDVLEASPDVGPPVQVARLIADRLNALIAPSSLAWRQFFLEHCTDPTGVARNLCEELATTGALRDASLDQLNRLLAATEQFLDESIRLHLEYLWQIGRRPVLVIDNVDQLKARYIDALGRFAFVLAEGTSGKPNAARVIFAARAIHVRRMQEAVGTVIVGELQPADIATMIERRLQFFLNGLGEKVAPSETIPMPKGGEIRVKEWLTSDDTPERYLRDLLEVSTRLLITANTPYDKPAELVQRLNYHNTRVTLIVIGQYVASAHLPWVQLYLAVRDAHGDPEEQRAAAARILHWPQLFHALFLGTRTNHVNDTSWLFHLFNDGSKDRIGVMIRIRVLRAIAADDGTDLDTISDTLERLFGYPRERTQRVWHDLVEYGLIFEPRSDRFALSDAGKAYVNEMIHEFEYLQHVLVDAWTDATHFVKIEPEEDAETRFRRVLAFADWIRLLEVAEYRHVIARGEHERFDSYYGDETIATSLCDCLVTTDRLATAIKGPYRSLIDQARSLKAMTSFDAIRQAAGGSREQG